jgi:bifunctional DNA-binding transcriptional regulator/antitoxin component of YhaV-PrlF toxin-antitoxin module
MNKSIKSVINAILRERILDIRTLRKSLSGPEGRLNLLPLPIGLGRVLIPVKVRKTIGANDGAFAYVNLYSIDKVSGDKNAVITLKSGREINCLESVRTIRKRMKLSAVIGDRFTLCVTGERERADFKDYDKPATKSDIMVLTNAMLKLIGMVGK